MPVKYPRKDDFVGAEAPTDEGGLAIRVSGGRRQVSMEQRYGLQKRVLIAFGRVVRSKPLPACSGKSDSHLCGHRFNVLPGMLSRDQETASRGMGTFGTPLLPFNKLFELNERLGPSDLGNKQSHKTDAQNTYWQQSGWLAAGPMIDDRVVLSKFNVFLSVSLLACFLSCMFMLPAPRFPFWFFFLATFPSSPPNPRACRLYWQRSRTPRSTDGVTFGFNFNLHSQV